VLAPITWKPAQCIGRLHASQCSPSATSCSDTRWSTCSRNEPKRVAGTSDTTPWMTIGIISILIVGEIASFVLGPAVINTLTPFYPWRAANEGPPVPEEQYQERFWRRLDGIGLDTVTKEFLATEFKRTQDARNNYVESATAVAQERYKGLLAGLQAVVQVKGWKVQIVFVGVTCGSMHVESFNGNMKALGVLESKWDPIRKKLVRRLLEEQDKVLRSYFAQHPTPYTLHPEPFTYFTDFTTGVYPLGAHAGRLARAQCGTLHRGQSSFPAALFEQNLSRIVPNNLSLSLSLPPSLPFPLPLTPSLSIHRGQL
jgi:hypothetical protein